MVNLKKDILATLGVDVITTPITFNTNKGEIEFSCWSREIFWC